MRSQRKHLEIILCALIFVIFALWSHFESEIIANNFPFYTFLALVFFLYLSAALSLILGLKYYKKIGANTTISIMGASITVAITTVLVWSLFMIGT